MEETCNLSLEACGVLNNSKEINWEITNSENSAFRSNNKFTRQDAITYCRGTRQISETMPESDTEEDNFPVRAGKGNRSSVINNSMQLSLRSYIFNFSNNNKFQ